MNVSKFCPINTQRQKRGDQILYLATMMRLPYIVFMWERLTFVRMLSGLPSPGYQIYRIHYEVIDMLKPFKYTHLYNPAKVMSWIISGFRRRISLFISEDVIMLYIAAQFLVRRTTDLSSYNPTKIGTPNGNDKLTAEQFVIPTTFVHQSRFLSHNNQKRCSYLRPASKSIFPNE